MRGTEGTPPTNTKKRSGEQSQPPGEKRRFQPPTWYTRIDDTVFAIEAGLVTCATALMTLFIFFSILFEFANGQYLQAVGLSELGSLWSLDLWTFYFVETTDVLRFVAPSGEAFVFDRLETSFHLGALAPTSLTVSGILALFWGAVSSHPKAAKQSAGVRFALALAGLALFFGFVAIMLSSHPKWTCWTVAAAGGLYSGVFLKKTHAPFGGWIIWFVAVFGFAYFGSTVDERFSSWTPHSYALFLLLWTCFIGASMVTSKARHLRIDAPRKAVPEQHLHMFNAVSFTVAALFTGALCVLSAMYFINRLGGQTAEGEIPDWLKVLAIPVALGLVTIRFAFRSLWAAMGFSEPLGEEVKLPVEEEAA